MDEFNRELNSFDEYAPIEQNTTPPPAFQEDEVVNTEITPEKIETDETAETVDIDTADDEDTFKAFDKAESETPVVTPPVNPQPVYNGYNTNQQNIPAYNQQYQQQYTPVRPTVNQYQQPVYNQPNGNTNQGYPVNQYNQPQMYNTQYRPMQSQNVQPPQYTQPQQMPNQAPVRAPQQGVVPPAYPTQNNPYAQRPVQNPAQNPYAQYQSPYNAQVPVSKPKTPTGTKVLIGILIGLLILFMIGFLVSCSMYMLSPADAPSDNPLSGYATEPPLEEFYGFDDSSPFSPYFNSNSYEGDYFDEKITLMADEGETQEKGEDKKNSYAPDKDAKGVEFKELPKDKDDKKYTTQSAYNAVADSVVSVVCYEDKITDNINDIVGEGTGTVISSDGYIVTNSHVIGDSKAYKINIVFNNSDEYEAKIVGYDTRTDLAVLKIDAKDLSYTKFSDSSKVEVGQDVVAIGNPGGSSFQNSLTKGIVSAVERELDLGANVDYIQIDAAINPGNSGGPLCNLYGQVIGINTAKISADAYEGMGFAIPSNKVAQIANDLIHYGYVKDRVRIGIMGREVDEEMKYSYNVPDGVLITEIAEDGPLYNTDIKEYDIITAIDGVEVSSFQEIFAILEEHKPGDKVELTLYRLEG